MINFSPTALAEFRRLLARYPNRRSALMPVLWLAQREFQVITAEVADYLGELMELPAADIYSVASFYTLYNRAAVGKHHIYVCRNVTCFMRGCNNIIAQLKDRLGIKLGETTSDRLFTLATAECLGACDGAPMMMIDERYYENLTPSRVDEILMELRDEESRDKTAAAQHRRAGSGYS
jgi:NADH-quinone oxidoreductase E subunit